MPQIHEPHCPSTFEWPVVLSSHDYCWTKCWNMRQCAVHLEYPFSVSVHFFFALPTIFILEILFSFFLYVLIQFHLQRHFLRLWKTLNFVQFMGIVIMPIIVYFITESWWNISCFVDLIWLEWNKNLEAGTHLKWMMVACLNPCHRGLPIHSEPVRLILGTSQKKALVLQQINKN